MTTESGRFAGAGAVPGRPLVIAHRGASVVRPENTLEAFVAAADLGADWVELDVQRSEDGVLVVHHDAQLADGRAIARLAVDALPPSVPTLADALTTCVRLDLGVNVEIKSDPQDVGYDPEYPVVRELAALLDGAPARADGSPRFLVSSFDPRCLVAFRATGSRVASAQLALELRDAAATIERARQRGHAAINPLASLVDAPLVELARVAGLAVYPWTVDDPQRMRELVALGVDGIITNVPDVLRAVLS